VEGAATEEPHPAPQVCPDPTDQMLWDLLAERPEATLVTGERRLQQSDHFPGRVLSPRQFVERYLDS
jgi:predicted nucleic acid-binding protein